MLSPTSRGVALLTVAAWAGTAPKAAPASMATATSDRAAPSLRGSRRRLIGGSELQSMQGSSRHSSDPQLQWAGHYRSVQSLRWNHLVTGLTKILMAPAPPPGA